MVQIWALVGVLLALRHSEVKATLLVGLDVTHLLRAGGVTEPGQEVIHVLHVRRKPCCGIYIRRVYLARAEFEHAIEPCGRSLVGSLPRTRSHGTTNTLYAAHGLPAH